MNEIKFLTDDQDGWVRISYFKELLKEKFEEQLEFREWANRDISEVDNPIIQIKHYLEKEHSQGALDILLELMKDIVFTGI